jgi:hypothetical protein
LDSKRVQGISCAHGIVSGRIVEIQYSGIKDVDGIFTKCIKYPMILSRAFPQSVKRCRLIGGGL